jgi:hypothetical protein
MTLPDAYNDDADLPAGDEPAPPEVSPRSRGVALGLCLIGGWCGLHRFYLEKPKSAVAMILTIGGLGIWWLYDLVLLAAGEFRDAEDVPVRRWGVGASPFLPRELTTKVDRRMDDLQEQFEALRQQFNDLAERVDFAERMLAQQREPPRLPPPSSSSSRVP